MNKLIGLVSFGMLVGFLSMNAEAAGAARGAKAVANVNYTTTSSSVSVQGASVVYQVIIGTGTAGTDYVALFDSATSGAVSGPTITTNLKTKIHVSSATQNTVVTFDPPLQFNNGIVAVNSVIGLQTAITYERGRVVTGY